MVSLVERMLKLHKDLPKARTAPDKTAIERQIAATDKQIDALVYELYGLTEEEIRIVINVGIMWGQPPYYSRLSRTSGTRLRLTGSASAAFGPHGEATTDVSAKYGGCPRVLM